MTRGTTREIVLWCSSPPLLQGARASFESAIVARLGGDEFCLAVSGPDVEHLVEAANELCRQGWEILPSESPAA